VSQYYNILRKTLIYSTAVLITTGAIVVGISYQVLSKLTFAGDRVIYGKSLSALTEEVSSELLKRPDLTPVAFESEDGITVAGYLIRRQHATANVVLCHGYRSTKELMYGYLDLFPEWNILLFDFRAHGHTNGSITSLGYHEYKDVVSAAHFMKNIAKKDKTNHLPTFILGISMGGAATLKALETNPGLCDAAVIDSTYARLNSTMLKAFSSKSYLPLYPFFPVIKLLFHYFAACDVHAMNPEQSVKKIDIPLLFIHSVSDNYLSCKNALTLFSRVKNPKSKLWVGPACRHGWLHSYFGTQYQNKVQKFLAGVTASKN
jgi:pimeloyl-ACP methyl ester carboxylesterase